MDNNLGVALIRRFDLAYKFDVDSIKKCKHKSATVSGFIFCEPLTTRNNDGKLKSRLWANFDSAKLSDIDVTPFVSGVDEVRDAIVSMIDADCENLYSFGSPVDYKSDVMHLTAPVSYQGSTINFEFEYTYLTVKGYFLHEYYFLHDVIKINGNTIPHTHDSYIELYEIGMDMARNYLTDKESFQSRISQLFKICCKYNLAEDFSLVSIEDVKRFNVTCADYKQLLMVLSEVENLDQLAMLYNSNLSTISGCDILKDSFDKFKMVLHSRNTNNSQS